MSYNILSVMSFVEERICMLPCCAAIWRVYADNQSLNAVNGPVVRGSNRTLDPPSRNVHRGALQIFA